MLNLRLILKNINHTSQYVRTMTAKPERLVDLTVDKEGVAVLTMQRLPANTLNLELLTSIRDALDEVERNQYKGMILTSASSTTFSGGLDLNEIYKPDIKRLDTFWTAFQDVWLKLFGSKFVTAAAINGHAPAGGCLLALSCEYRVMVNGKYNIGLNETAIGLTARQFFVDSLCHTISMRQAELALTTGRLYPVNEALKIGLVDEIATDKFDAVDRCKKFIKVFETVSPAARSFTKQNIRAASLKSLQDNRQKEKEEFLKHALLPESQKNIETILKKFKRNKL